ncbi:RDD family protein [Marinoscillum sp.]|uniref:RDD family protein n=1 Tax=Marinoscillum sp. TaxID=2024838 RepID=UPI003BA95CD6
MSEKKYAGFWLRFVAYIVDKILISTVQWIVILPVLGALGISMASMENMEYMSEEDAIGMVIGMVSTMIGSILVAYVIELIYFSLMEASKYQASIGKMALGLKVTDTDGKPLDFGKALLRNLGKIVSQMIIYIGYIMAGLTEKKQALHDMIAGALVVKK